MGDRLNGKIAVVVGAGQTPGDTIGNGRASAILYAREGAKVMVVAGPSHAHDIVPWQDTGVWSSPACRDLVQTFPRRVHGRKSRLCRVADPGLLVHDPH